MSNKSCRGIIPFIHNISEAEIDEVIRVERRLYPEEGRTDEELRPLAVNTILRRRREN